jgi:uncharacterized repeat protein (TIGR01451 family)
MSRLRRMVIVAVLTLGLVPVLVVSGASAQAAAPVDVFISDVTDSPDPVALQGTVFYFVPVGNRGPGTATAVTVTAQLPAGVTFQPAGSTGCTATLTTVTCTVSTLPAGLGAGLIVAVTPTAGDLVSMTFTASAAETDRDPSNNTQTETTTVISEADVALDLGSVFGVVYAGQRFFLSVRMSNAGPSPATGVTVTLRLPAALSVASGASCTPDGAGSVCTIGSNALPPSAGSVALIEMSASAAGDHTITGSVVADQPDPQPANNADSVTVTVTPAADVAVAVAESADPTAAGKPLTYTVTVTNHGPSPASAVSVTDEWSAAVSGGVTLLSIGTSQGQCTVTAPGQFRCEFGVLTAGDQASVTLRLRPQGVGSVTNRAEVTVAEHDPDPTNNAVTETTVVG